MALSANTVLTEEVSNQNSIPAAASATLYEGAMIGEADGYGRALTAGDKFLGHNIAAKVDNSSGSPGDKNVTLKGERYRMQVSVTGLLITDVGQPVYASDDATLTMIGASTSAAYSYVGVVKRYISSGVGIVEFRPGEEDEFGNNENRILKSDNYSVLTADSGKVIYVGTDAKVMTLLATEAGIVVTFVNAGADAAVLLCIDPNGSDLILGGCGLAAGGDGKKANNTKTTAKRGDYITLLGDGLTASGWRIVAKRGTWAMES